ncbi:MAG: hypothetical protein JKY41_13705 [Rhodobacteraceae bacterium]|nr:hypothetical protein [Paracoccaceae bacterium]
MKYLFIIFLSFLPILALAQDEDPFSECAAVLAAPPFVDILTRNEGNDFRELSPLKSGRALLGLECGVGEVIEFFEGAGWELQQLEENNLLGPFERGDGTADFYIDAVADFCLKRPPLFGIFDFRCRPIASVYFHEGRISSLHTSMSK